MRHILAVDMGSSRLRAALVDAQGDLAAQEAVPMPATAGQGEGVELAPELWWRAFQTCIEGLAQAAPAAFRAVAAIAVTGITRTQVLVDRAGQAVRPALLWDDTRAGATLPGLLSACPAGHPETAGLNAYHPLARLWWLKETEPAALAAAAHVLEPKDYLNLRLTGAAAGDAVSHVRLATAARPAQGVRSLLDAAGLPPGLLPPLHAPPFRQGVVQAGLSGALALLQGVPVTGIGHDTWASVVGLGALRAGGAYNLSGTTEVLGVLTAAPARADGLVSVDWGGGLTQLGGPSLAGGDTLAWLRELMDVHADTSGSALDALLSRPPDPEPPLFLPYLKGERVPFWEPALRGAWIGLSRRHGRADLAWSVLEGVAHLNRLVLDRAVAATGEMPAEVRFGGGGAANAVWCQIKADVLALPVVVPAGEEHGLIGAAIAAWTALGHYPSLEAAQLNLVRAGRRWCPSAGMRGFHDHRYRLFRDASEWALDLSRRWPRPRE
jgi:xylulokinase